MVRRIVVAGVAGGVGTTTVAALLAGALAGPGARPTLIDRSGGELAARLDPAVLERPADPAVSVHDLGAALSGPGALAALSPDAIPVVVVAATPAGFLAAERVLGAARAAKGIDAARRILVVPVAVGRTGVTTAAVKALAADVGARILPTVPRDPRLASGAPAAIGSLPDRVRSAVLAVAAAVAQPAS